ncbi:unnamed protein product, partial [Owenia fusiformis]
GADGSLAVTFSFSATRGSGGSKGDICLDDIVLKDGPCSKEECIWGAWSKNSTSSCSVTCGGGILEETWQRTSTSGGPCSETDIEIRTIACSEEPCEIDCAWGEFSEWEGGNCTEDCKIVEQRIRYYGGDAECPADNETETRTVECTKSPCRRISCDFQSISACSFSNDISTGYLWREGNGQTATSFTGPDSDHTTGQESGKYIYLEASDVPREGEVRISTPVFESYGESCVTFWYHMKGYYMGTVNVYVEDESSSVFSLDEKVWSSFGHRGLLWNFAYIDIPNRSTFRIVFEGVRGSASNSDAAIDDVLIREGPCTVAGLGVSCDFEDQYLCGYSQSQEDTLEWSWETIATPTTSTGCSSDHTNGDGTGHYLYIEASNIQAGRRAELTSALSEFNPGDKKCLTWWYHMNGVNTGDLLVNADIASNKSTIATWSRSGAQGNTWLQGELTVSPGVDVTFSFSATRGSGGSKGDICLDDILLTDGEC